MDDYLYRLDTLAWIAADVVMPIPHGSGPWRRTTFLFVLHLLASLLSRKPRWPLPIPEDFLGGHFGYAFLHDLAPV